MRVEAVRDRGGQRITLANARAVVGLPFPLPNTSLAGPRDPAAWFASLVRQATADPMPGCLGTVNGHVAAILVPTHPSTYQPRSVDFVQNGVSISVTSTTYGTATLMRVADNMAARAVGT